MRNRKAKEIEKEKENRKPKPFSNPIQPARPTPSLLAQTPAPPPALTSTQSCPIRGQRIRFDQDPIFSEPSDPDPRAQIKTYPFDLAFFLKSPWVFLVSTRGLVKFKTNSNQALFYSLRPLSFLEIEPAI